MSLTWNNFNKGVLDDEEEKKEKTEIQSQKIGWEAFNTPVEKQKQTQTQTDIFDEKEKDEKPIEIDKPIINKEESKIKDIFDEFRLKGNAMWQGVKQTFLSVVPNQIFRDRTLEDLPPTKEEYKEATEKNLEITNKKNKEKREWFRKQYIKQDKKYQEWIEEHPELQPRKEWEEGVIKTIKKNPAILKDPAYWGYLTAGIIPFALTTMGTTIAVTAKTKNPVAGMVAGAAVSSPVIAHDLYEELIINGATLEQASSLSVKVTPLIASIEVLGDIPILSSILKPFKGLLIKKITKEFAEEGFGHLLKTGAKKFTTIEIAEILEENTQNIIQKATIKTVNENIHILENIPETTIHTLMATTPFAFLGGGMQMRTELKDRKLKELNEKIEKTTGKEQEDLIKEEIVIKNQVEDFNKRQKEKEEIDLEKPAIELQEEIEDKKEKKVKKIYHGTPVDVKKIIKEGFIFGKNSAFGKAAFFTDSKKIKEKHGENTLKIVMDKFKLKHFTLQEQMDFIKKMKVNKLASAIRKEGKYDGFIVTNSDPIIGTTYGITNNKLLNEVLGVKEEKKKPVIKKQIKFTEKELTEEKKKFKSNDFITEKTLNTKIEMDFYGEYKSGTFKEFLIEAKKNGKEITKELNPETREWEYKITRADNLRPKAPKITQKIYDFYKSLSNELTETEDNIKKYKKQKAELLKEYKDKGIDISELQKGMDKRREKIQIKEKELEDLSAEFKEKVKVEKKVEKKVIEIKETDYQSIINERQEENKTFYDIEAKGSEGASVGVFKEEKEITLGDIEKIRPIEFPELVDMARELMDDVPTLKNFSRSLGKFYSKGKGKIKLKPELFKKGQEKQLSAILAHEIGHLIDYLPQKTLKRGNLLGRLMSLRKFLKNTYGYLSVSNKELREELKTASLYWRPTNNWNAYRNSAKELYADAISMLFVNPGKLQKLAPNFYNNFFKSLDNKEEVKKAYFELQEILRGDKKSIIERRRKGVKQMFNKADYKAKDLQRINEEDKKKRKLNFWTAFKFNIKSVNQEVYDKVNEVEKQNGYINPDYNPKYLLEERNYLGSLIKAQFEKFVQPIHKDLEKNNIGWNDFGEILMYERITSGDRSEMANPRGISPIEAQEMLDNLKQELGEEKTKILETNLDMFRNFNQSIIEEAYNEGLIKDDMYKKIQDNPKYATYRVIEYMDKNVDWKMKRQIGTLKDIDNPANAMLLKIMSSIRATHNQKIRIATIKLLEKNYKDDIKDAKMVWTGKTHAPIKSKDRNEKLITYYEKGKLSGKYVDPYIASSIENNTIGRNQMVVKLLSPITFLNRKYFRPIFVIYNPGWIPFNFVRDFVRFWKNMPNMSLSKASKRYYQAGKIAKARIIKKDGEGKDLLIEMEQNMVINTLTWNDFLIGETTEDKQIVDILKRTGVIENKKKKYNLLLRPIVALGRAIRTVGDYIETLPKAAAFIEVKKNLTPEKASYIRKKAGSPDFFEKGYLTPATNEIFLFSNPFIQAWFADIEVAIDPKTRSGFWFKTVVKEMLPKLLMFGALMGLLGDDTEEIMNGVNEYDKMNYTIIPIGIDKINGKSIYLRIPTDETGRVLGGIFWKLLKTAKGDKMAEISQILNYAGGQVPSLTPSIGLPIKITKFLQGENPYDDFRGKNVISETEFEAGGWYKTKPFLGWIFQQSGGNIFYRFNISTYMPIEKTKREKILKLPVVSNIIGRWLKISDHGKREKLKEEIIDPAKKERTIEKLKERKIINKYIEKYRITNKSINAKIKLERKLIKEIIGHFPRTKTESTKAGNLKRQFRVSLAYGQNNPKISSLMEAETNDIKIKLLKEFDKELSKEEFNKLKKILLQYKVVSSTLLRNYKRIK